MGTKDHCHVFHLLHVSPGVSLSSSRAHTHAQLTHHQSPILERSLANCATIPRAGVPPPACRCATWCPVCRAELLGINRLPVLSGWRLQTGDDARLCPGAGRGGVGGMGGMLLTGDPLAGVDRDAAGAENVQLCRRGEKKKNVRGYSQPRLL